MPFLLSQLIEYWLLFTLLSLNFSVLQLPLPKAALRRSLQQWPSQKAALPVSTVCVSFPGALWVSVPSWSTDLISHTAEAVDSQTWCKEGITLWKLAVGITHTMRKSPFPANRARNETNQRTSLIQHCNFWFNSFSILIPEFPFR